MTTPFDTEMADLATELLAEFGVTGTFIAKTSGVYDSATETVSGSTTTTNTAQVAPPMDYREHFNMLEKPEVTSLQTIVGPVTFAINNGDRVTIGAGTFRVVHVHRLVSGDDVAARVISLAV